MNTPKVMVLMAVTLLAACSPDRAPAELDEAARRELVARAAAPLFDGMGDYHRAITTSDPGAQLYFDQGMVLAFGFNHAESIRSFRAAQRLDPLCAMCFWGEALATGPNINVTSNGRVIMSAEDRVAAYEAIKKAVELQGSAAEIERSFIQALATRYSSDPEAERGPQDIAYANAMRQLVDQYPEDDDAAAMFAEAWMNTMPWDYWSEPGEPKLETVDVIAALETILARTPDHPLAIHLYIHAVEASSNPGRAEDEADRLANLVPGSGHLVHMPAHVYWRVGRYHDAAEANVLAAAVDEAYIAQCNAQGFYPALYYPHNIHFLWAASSMEGRSEVAIDAARRLAGNVRIEQIEEFPTIEFFKTVPLLALTQFGRWNDILAEPRPAEDLDYSNAIWHYARGTALGKLGRIEEALEERKRLAGLKDSVQANFLDANDYPATVLLAIADELLQGDISMAREDFETAVFHFSEAVEAQDSLPYMEPPFWYYPTRQSLGHSLLLAGRASEAEAIYRRDLEDYPMNGWSMFGLIQSLQAQNRTDEVPRIQQMFDNAWMLADVELTGSRM